MTRTSWTARPRVGLSEAANRAQIYTYIVDF